MNGNNSNSWADIHDPKLMLRRRDALKFGAAGAAALAGLGFSGVRKASAADTATTCLTQGPFWVDELLNRQDVRSDPTTGVVQAGLPLRLNISVSRLTAGVAAPLVGAWVDIWHAGSAGAYSDANGAGNPNTIGQRWLRGYQVTDSHGMARFITVYPGWYIGRTVHIHARIRTFNGATVVQNFTTQLFFTDAASTTIFNRLSSTYSHSGTRTLNASDGIYTTVAAAGLARMADDQSHAVASFNIKLDASQGPCSLRGFAPNGSEYLREDDHEFDFGGGTPTLALRRMFEPQMPFLDGPDAESKSGMRIA